MAASSEDRVGSALAPWLEAQLPGATSLKIVDLVEPKQGFSSRTVLFTAVWEQGPKQCDREFVARIERPTTCPMLADIFFQHDVMKAIAAHSDAAVPGIVLSERTGEVLGEPFFLMDRVRGRVPSDFPSFHSEGWVCELPAKERERLWWNGIAEMAKLHRAPVEAFIWLAKGKSEPPGSIFYLRYFIQTWLDWAAELHGFPVLEQAIAYLLANVPAHERPGLVWNDARMGNTMFADDLSVAALFDFEVASLGPAEIDLAWWLYCEDLFTVQFGIPRLPGIPVEEEAILGFERCYGRAMPEFDYYLAIAALKHAILAIRDYSNGKRVRTPGALPGFAMERLRLYIERHQARRAGERRAG